MKDILDITSTVFSNPKAQVAFARLPDLQKEEYLRFINDADNEEVRNKRIEKFLGVLVKIAQKIEGEKSSNLELINKLGLKDGMSFVFYGAPWSYFMELGLSPVDTPDGHSFDPPYDFIQLFTETKRHLAENFANIKRELNKEGILWVSWPKKETGISPDLDDNAIRDIILPEGLIDIKVISVDEVWSGLKFVYPKG